MSELQDRGCIHVDTCADVLLHLVHTICWILGLRSWASDPGSQKSAGANAWLASCILTWGKFEELGQLKDIGSTDLGHL